ncbi:tRNA uridine-5-carboxymethylaminomethyl(34) synthesis GTPase MnmE [Sphingomonas cannabina]|uniref:tRNA uridine-5-carboxymethylaminomethyl(34) synthesis GTPase MnmE n=1 Tax=Sphingomonas cannabina TaxID=2899123 RepID=UPI001F23D1CD|nr:tRNA uridine-5-carboxymethylaminomethyl(34) synthesis GTPase MnmE [Sphingomonas cannabina]UIJ45727.1 tRNA uridine-5-carboxymethylaminomethyl(34) synthesis GTPase MnmE [Sphingomonas cannabina]
MSDTIFALSSGTPPAAIAIIRLSGAGAFAAVKALAGRLPGPRSAALRSLRDPATGALLDRALVLLFPGPDSATGEDVAELHLHGGRAVVRAVDAVLAAMPGLRAAEPGEFTRRALANGRIDLTEAEGLADLLAAETEAQRRSAIASAEGGLRRQVEQWSARTVTLAARIEAAIDHEDEGDVEAESIATGVREDAGTLAREIEAMLVQPPAERLHEGIRVVLAGPPNSGKSTLLNAMAGREAAIVSPIAGTTRDRIEAPVTRRGIAWLLTDTAGLAAETDDPIEAIGIARAREAAALADIVLWLGDEAPPEPAMLAIHPRADARPSRPERLAISAATGEGMEALWDVLVERATTLLPVPDAVALNRRQAELASAAAAALDFAAVASDPLLIAEELRHALVQFDRLTGRAGVENVLDDLFSRFCIGK